MTTKIKIQNQDVNIHDLVGEVKEAGALYHKDWPLPTLWAITDNKRCYSNSAQGDDLVITATSSLLGLLERSPHDLERAKSSLGL